MWVKEDDKFHEHPWVLRLLEDGGLAALGLYKVASAWCGDNFETDGLITGFVLSRFGVNWATYAAQLVASGLWEAAESDGRPAFQFHRWTDERNGLVSCDAAADIIGRRKDAVIRKQVYSDPELVAEIKARDCDRCRYCGVLVKWSDRRSTNGGTFDHVVPLAKGGKNTADNLVVACRGCNGRKGDKTVAEAGMRKLRPGVKGAADFDDPAEHDGTRNRGVEVGSGQVGSGTRTDLVTSGGDR